MNCTGCGRFMTKVEIVDDPLRAGAAVAWWICYHCRTEFPERSKTADIVGFARNILGLRLYPYQEELLRQSEMGAKIVIQRKPGRIALERVMDEYRQFMKMRTLNLDVGDNR